MKVEVTNYKKVSVGSAKKGDVVEIHDKHYLVLNPDESSYVNKSDFGKRTMLAHLESGDMIAPINSVSCVIVKTAKVTITI